MIRRIENRTRSSHRRSLGFDPARLLPALAGVALMVVASERALGQTAADSAATRRGLTEYLDTCHRDGGRLWGVSLCGPLIVVDGMSGFAMATAVPPAGHFERHGRLWIGRVPKGMQVANTAMDWAGQRWSTVRFPLPDSQFHQRQLLLHESFHRVQPGLGLEARDAINGHLDSRDGRILLRLELRALAKAVTSPPAEAGRAVIDAATFRARRYQLFPGADTLEYSLEIQEGLAEYTGTRLALGAANIAKMGNVTDAEAQFESEPTFVRSLGYGTGPLLGLLLDRFAPRWRSRVRAAGFAAQLWAAVRFSPPADLAAAVKDRMSRYHGDQLTREETSREENRARALADYRARLIEGPVVILLADQLSRSFNPNNLVPLDNAGTVYPDGAFEADWGTLTVSEGGALVAPSNREVRVAAKPTIDPAARTISGPGWVLHLKEGWVLKPGQRDGDWTVARGS